MYILQFSTLQEAVDMTIMWQKIIRVLRSDNKQKEATIAKPKQKDELPKQ